MALFLACNVEKNLDFAFSIFFSSWICLCTWQYSLRHLEHYRCCDHEQQTQTWQYSLRQLEHYRCCDHEQQTKTWQYSLRQLEHYRAVTSQSQFRSVWSNYINSFCFKLFSSFWVGLLALRYQSIWTIRSNPEQLLISSLLLHAFEERRQRFVDILL